MFKFEFIVYNISHNKSKSTNLRFLCVFRKNSEKLFCHVKVHSSIELRNIPSDFNRLFLIKPGDYRCNKYFNFSRKVITKNIILKLTV